MDIITPSKILDNVGVDSHAVAHQVILADLVVITVAVAAVIHIGNADAAGVDLFVLRLDN